MRFWLRWSMRDLRRRWLVVLAIAMTIAIGTGAYAGLSGLSEWRRLSNDVSFARLAMHDLRITLNTGSSVTTGELAVVVREIPGRDSVAGVEERLIAPTQIDASTPGRTVVTPGRIVGIPVADSTIDLVGPRRGRGLVAGDEGRPVAVLEYNFARHYELSDSGSVTLAGGHRVSYVGQGLSPEYFIVSTEVSFFGTEANFAIVFAPLSTAQAWTNQAGRVNDAVIRLTPGADVDGIRSQLQARLAAQLPDVGATVLTRRDNDGYRVLYDDIDGDQEIYNIFAVILLGAGTFAAFNLASRIIESQRRELGVGMAIGVPPWMLAVRPLLLGVQIAVLGVAFGIPFGIWVGNSFLSVVEHAVPLPEYRSPFQGGVYAQGAVLGAVLPILATALPTWRAVRMSPVRAIQAGFRSTRGGGLTPLIRRVSLPGRSVARMPLRNLLRAPRRTLFTVLGISAAVTTVVGATGMVDSFVGTIDRSQAALVGSSPNRVQVTLGAFVARNDPLVAAINATQGVHRTEPALSSSASLLHGDTKIDVVLEVMDADSAIWRPTLTRGAFVAGDQGVVISTKAAADLGAQVGNTIVVRHPRRVGEQQLRLVDSPVRVAGIDANPIRVYAYMDTSQAELFGLAGATNLVNLEPAPGVDTSVLKRALLQIPGVASAERVAAGSEAITAALNDYTSVLRIVEVVALALALLIASNSASIAADERAREHATMFAFGVPLRTILRNSMTEGGIAGVGATAVGIGVGLLLIRYIVMVTTPRVAPDLGATVLVSAGTIVAAAVLGIVATALAPLLGTRKLSRMDVPSTLRVVE